jgi:hypothetical protein
VRPGERVDNDARCFVVAIGLDGLEREQPTGGKCVSFLDGHVPRTRKAKGIPAMTTTTATDDRKVIPNLPPLNWKREIPKYRISRDTKPAPKERFKFEPPFASCSEADIWQYGERIHKAGEIIATTFWPNAGTMTPLNYSARQVMEYFTSRQKSRLARAPWRDG